MSAIIVKSRLLECIANDGRTVKAQAELIGFKRSQLYGWMNGRYDPSAYTLKKLARFYKVSIDWLLGMDLEDDR